MRYLILFTLLTSCVTAYRPHGYRGGYSEAHLGDNVWKVQFVGNGFLSQETVETYALRRAEEVCFDSGFLKLTILEREPRVTSYKLNDTTRCTTNRNVTTCEHIIGRTINKYIMILFVKCEEVQDADIT